MAEKPTVPKGTRDFTPLEMTRRNHIFDTIRGVFRRYGYRPIETPAMETLSTLTGKYGEEGDKLLFRVLNSGDFKNKLSREDLLQASSSRLGAMISEKGLRYDLTVPFARFVVQHRGELQFPFKRYQIQPVWRADRPQRGRYREFYQCDVDVIGSRSLLNEYELVRIMDDGFRELGLNVQVRINNRKVLAGIAGAIGEPERLTEMTVAIDKLEKAGLEKVLEELAGRGFGDKSLDRLRPVLTLEGSLEDKQRFLEEFLAGSETGSEGLREIRELFSFLEGAALKAGLEFDLTLARGLNYYTGTIFEVRSTELVIGSICGGGRYDDLTGIFGLDDVSGVGISFGADRIYDVMLQLKRFPETVEEDTRVLFVNFGNPESARILPLVQRLREAGVASELYPDPVKMKKQMGYANNRGIPFVALSGEEEQKRGVVTLKEMESGRQESLTPDQLIGRLTRE